MLEISVDSLTIWAFVLSGANARMVFTFCLPKQTFIGTIWIKTGAELGLKNLNVRFRLNFKVSEVLVSMNSYKLFSFVNWNIHFATFCKFHSTINVIIYSFTNVHCNEFTKPSVHFRTQEWCVILMYFMKVYPLNSGKNKLIHLLLQWTFQYFLLQRINNRILAY